MFLVMFVTSGFKVIAAEGEEPKKDVKTAIGMALVNVDGEKKVMTLKFYK